MARAQELSGEREKLEHMLNLAPKEKHADWIGRLLSKDDAEHVGVWFEIALFDWLANITTDVVVEPDIDGARPDFAIDIHGQKIALEARVILRKPQVHLLYHG